MNLTDAEKKAIISFTENRFLFETIKKVFIDPLQIDTFTNDYDNLSNERLGEKIRALIQAIVLIQDSFAELETYKRAEQKRPQVNEAR